MDTSKPFIVHELHSVMSYNDSVLLFYFFMGWPSSHNFTTNRSNFMVKDQKPKGDLKKKKKNATSFSSHQQPAWRAKSVTMNMKSSVWL